MPKVNINGSELNYKEFGPEGAPFILMSPLVFTNISVYEPIIRHLEDSYHIVVYDHKGLGQSEKPANKTLEQSARDVIALIEKLDLGPCHFVGNCLGAFVGLQLAAIRPDLLKSCILMGASAEADRPDAIEEMDEFVDMLKLKGIRSQIDILTQSWFGNSFRNTRDADEIARRQHWLKHVESLSAAEIESIRQIFHRKNLTAELEKIRCPVLILAGGEDAPENIETYKRLCRAIPRSEFRLIRYAGFALAIEQPDQVADLVRNHVIKVEHHLASEKRFSRSNQSSVAGFEEQPMM